MAKSGTCNASAWAGNFLSTGTATVNWGTVLFEM